jgi:CHAT domain-containing protein
MSFLIHFCLGLLLCLIPVLVWGNPAPQADQLYQYGIELLSQGKPEAAYRTWQQALLQYQKDQNQNGVRRTFIGQSKAFQELGQPVNACHVATKALQIPENICDSSQITLDVPGTDPLTISALASLGISLRQLGHLDAAETMLQTALRKAPDSAATSGVQLQLANLDRDRTTRAWSRYRLDGDPDFKIKSYFQLLKSGKDALERYQRLQNDPQSQFAIAARLNWLLLYADLRQWTQTEPAGAIPELLAMKADFSSQLQPVIKTLMQVDWTELPPVDAVSSQLKFANALIDLHLEGPNPEQLLHNTLKQAEQLVHLRTQSLAWGTLGKLYLSRGNPPLASEAYDRARALANAIRAGDLAYQWDRALAYLYRKQQPQIAMSLYQEALKNLDLLRVNLFPAAREIQFGFATTVKPIYQEYLSLLLEAPQPNLQLATTLHEKLQLSELETYLQCGQLQVTPLSNIKTNPQPTVIHFVDMGTQIEVVVKFPNGQVFHHRPDATKVERAIRSVRLKLRDPQLSNYPTQYLLDDLQVIYQQLMAPIFAKQTLAENSTLVFVRDSSLDVPPALLHDGQHYLIERYGIAQSFGSQLRQPRLLPRKKLRSLLVGVSDLSPSFERMSKTKLPEVQAELSEVAHFTHRIQQLLNDQFTVARFKAKLTSSDVQVVHISTHASFSNNPEQTFLLAWDEKINILGFEDLFKHSP